MPPLLPGIAWKTGLTRHRGHDHPGRSTSGTPGIARCHGRKPLNLKKVLSIGLASFRLLNHHGIPCRGRGDQQRTVDHASGGVAIGLFCVSFLSNWVCVDIAWCVLVCELGGSAGSVSGRDEASFFVLRENRCQDNRKEHRRQVEEGRGLNRRGGQTLRLVQGTGPTDPRRCERGEAIGGSSELGAWREGNWSSQ